MILEGKICRLRPYCESDVDDMVNVYNNANVIKYLSLSFPFPYTKQDAEDWIKKCSEAVQATRFVVEYKGNLIGGIGFDILEREYQHVAELGYALGEKYWNKGIISEAIPLVVTYAFQHFNLQKLYAKVYEGNNASVRVLEKSGFTLEAALKKQIYRSEQYSDEYIYTIFKNSPLE